MSEEITKDLTQDEKLDLILSRLTAIETRLTAVEDRNASLEAKVDERLRDTRPIWEAIQAQNERIIERVTRIEEQNAEMAKTLRLIEKQQGLLNRDFLRFRGEQEVLEDRIHALEQQPA